MLTEEAHHLFVGETGIGRVIQRTAELMKQAPAQDVGALGGIPLDLIQRYINEWYSASLDLFGSEDSSNAASYFATGLKGRYNETSASKYPDHIALEGVYEIDVPAAAGRLTTEQIPLRRAMNLVLRDAYAEDCARAMNKWNGFLAEAGHPDRLALPSQRFNREVGVYAGLPFDPAGNLLSGDEFERRRGELLPQDSDRAWVESLMIPTCEPGRMAGWIAPPARGIDGKPIDFQYVHRAGPGSDNAGGR